MNISDYKDYEVEDFLEDEHFRKWVLEEGHSFQFFWQAYMKRYPSQMGKMEEARRLILDTYNFFHQQSVAIDLPNDGFGAKLKAEMEEELAPSMTKHLPRRRRIYQLAAACILFIGIFSLYHWQAEFKNRIEYATGNAEWEVITLPDGSKAVSYTHLTLPTILLV